MSKALFASVLPDALPEIAPMLQAHVDAQRMGGAVTLAWQNGKLVHHAAVGWRDVAAGRPMTPDAVFRLASMTKPIVSLATLMLVEEGRLDLGDPIERWLPEMANRRVLNHPAGALDDTRLSSRGITVEDLLTHRSGLSEGFVSVGPLAAAYSEHLYAKRHKAMTVDEWMNNVAQLPLSCDPGERFEYGCSTDVLGCLLTRVEGRSLAEILERRILGPLGMTDTRFWVPEAEQERLARTYVAMQEPAILHDITGPIESAPGDFESGAAGLYSTAADYLMFARLLLGEGAVGATRLVRAETVALMRNNRLSESQRQIPFLGIERFWTGQGFGLGLAQLLTEDGGGMGGPGAAGSFGWPGAFGTWWVADPANDLILIYLAQDMFPMSPSTVSQLVTGERIGARSGRVSFQEIAYARLAKRHR